MPPSVHGLLLFPTGPATPVYHSSKTRRIKAPPGPTQAEGVKQ